ncbi:hypothetical protein [Aeoliella sp. SH292]|uniref:hypothetical protein n=1 Tax=Aeoliella sp. SH292 TaxID=3454464 RepID=UPI003F96291E
MRTANRYLEQAPRLFLAAAALMLLSSALLAADESATPVSQLVSPDGRHIAYGQIAVGPNGEQKVRIIVGSADGTDRRALPIDANAVDEVQWYGNERIAFVTRHGEDGYQLIDMEGNPTGELRMPSGCDSFFHQCLSPDGKWIAFCGNYSPVDQEFANDRDRRNYFKTHPDVEQKHGLFLVNLEEQSVKQVLDETVANLPSWSPDSNYLACGIGHYVKDYPLAIIDADSGKVHKPAAKGTASGWSPDSRQLAVVTDIVEGGSWRGGIPLDGAVGVLDAAQFLGGGTSPITNVSDPPVNVSTKEPYSWSMSGAYGAVWSPDGEWLAYRHHDSTQSDSNEKTTREEIWIVHPDGNEARKVLNHGASELAWVDTKTIVWVYKGQFGVVDIELDGDAPLGPTPNVSGHPFAVTGRITDGEGRPLEGVEVRAATGWGTLRTSVPVKTDAAGHYELPFGPGMLFLDDGPNLQVATIYARKPGYYERDMCQNGALGMANYRPKDLEESGWNFKGIVYRGHPYELDFVMEPAAQLTVELVNQNGEPLADFSITLDGEELYPSCSILSSKKTNEKGEAKFTDVPLKAFWFSLGRHDELRTEAIDFTKSATLRYKLTYDDIAGTLTAASQ